MARYIDAEDFYKRQAKRCNNNKPIIGTCTMDNITLREALKKQPTAEVAEVRHGKWVHTDYAMHWLGKDECSECTYHTSDRDDLSHLKYCPNCGARMDGDEDDV